MNEAFITMQATTYGLVYSFGVTSKECNDVERSYGPILDGSNGLYMRITDDT